MAESKHDVYLVESKSGFFKLKIPVTWTMELLQVPQDSRIGTLIFKEGSNVKSVYSGIYGIRQSGQPLQSLRLEVNEQGTITDETWEDVGESLPISGGTLQILLDQAIRRNRRERRASNGNNIITTGRALLDEPEYYDEEF